jgi:hypothetical protein
MSIYFLYVTFVILGPATSVWADENPFLDDKLGTVACPLAK